MIEKNHFFAQLSKFRSSRARIVGEAQYRFYATWHHSAVWTYFTCDQKQRHPGVIGARLFPAATPAQVEESIRLLLILGLIKKTASGYAVTDKHLYTEKDLKAMSARAPKRFMASKRSAAAVPAEADALLRFNPVFRSGSGYGAMAAGFSYDPSRKLFLLESRPSTGVRMLPKPLLRFAGSLRREAVHGELGRIILPGTPFQATLADSDFVLESLAEGRFPMRLLGGDGYVYAVRESLDTQAGRAFTAETDPIRAIPPALPIRPCSIP